MTPTLIERISADIATAMRNRDQARLGALRMAKAALMNTEVQRGRALTEPEAQQVMASLIKQRRDSIEQFTAGGRTDLADKEAAEITTLETYLPPPIDQVEIDKAVEAAIAETGASSAKDLGRVMKAVMARFAGTPVDGKVVNEAVRRRLSRADAAREDVQTFFAGPRLILLKGTHKPLIHPPLGSCRKQEPFFVLAVSFSIHRLSDSSGCERRPATRWARAEPWYAEDASGPIPPFPAAEPHEAARPRVFHPGSAA